MHCVLLTTVIVVCAISVYASHPRPTIVLNYAFEPVVNDGKLVMRILLEFQSGPIETADLVVPTTWGDAKNLDKGITNLKNVQDAGHVRISYDLVKDWVVPPPRADHHAILEPEYFEFNTQNGLVHPKFATTARVEVHFDWRKLPPGWSLATSFGTGDRLQSFRGTWGGSKQRAFRRRGFPDLSERHFQPPSHPGDSQQLAIHG
jgi:hypothetical protein